MAEVLHAHNPPGGQPYFKTDYLRKSQTPQTSIRSQTPRIPASPKPSVTYHEEAAVASSSDESRSSSRSSSPTRDSTDNSRRSSLFSTPPSSDYHNKASLISSPPSSLHLDTQDEDDLLPSYSQITIQNHGRSSTPAPSPTTDKICEDSLTPANRARHETRALTEAPQFPEVVDDTAVREEPSRQVDYLSHDWKEEDIWYSWRHIVSRRKIYGERSRLENASWRTWTKTRYGLRTISPETLNWLKDCDVTWLYGPLQEAPSRRDQGSEPPSRISKNDSFLCKKPILKKRSVSEVMLQKSLSSSSLIRQAAAVVQAQRDSGKRGSSDEGTSPDVDHGAYFGSRRNSHTNALDATVLQSPYPSSSSSGLHTPDNGARRHIRFDNKVEQCIAVDFNTPAIQEVEEEPVFMQDLSESSEDEVVMMKPKPRKLPDSFGSRRNSVGQEGSGIAKLPDTTLKFHHEESSCLAHADESFAPLSKLQSSPSQETLRPPRPSTNFLLDDDVDADMSWEPSLAFNGGPRHENYSSDEDTERNYEHSGMRRTPSGMFMPFDDEEEASFGSTGILGRVVDTVNTAKDIAHVIWNVGWRK